jgi:hypothetical protein
MVIMFLSMVKIVKMQQKLYQSEEYLFCFELQGVIEKIQGIPSHKPVKFAYFLPFFVIDC